MADFANVEAVEDNIDDSVVDLDEENEDVYEDVSDANFIDDEKDFDENVEDYYAFTNVSRCVEEAMQDSFIDFDYSQEANNYCPDDYDPSEEIIKFCQKGRGLQVYPFDSIRFWKYWFILLCNSFRNWIPVKK